MMAKAVPGAAVLVSEVRAIAAALAEETLGATVHVLDDGLQHRSLPHDIDIVIVTGGDLRDRPIPFGGLRTSPRALTSVDAVIADTSGNGDWPGLGDLKGAERPREFRLDRRLNAPYWIGTTAKASGPTPLSPGDRVVAAAGIARPERFVSALRAAGFDVAEAISFPDHHEYRAGDLDRMRAAVARASAAALVTTEKDAIRLMPLRPLGMPVAVFPLVVSVEPAVEFKAWLIDRLAEVRR
jgi:tetraacyldisaccharide 4'-kinase